MSSDLITTMIVKKKKRVKGIDYFLLVSINIEKKKFLVTFACVSICMNQFLAMFHKYNARRSLLFIPAPQPNQLLLRGGGTTVSPIYLSFEIQQESNITNINDY